MNFPTSLCNINNNVSYFQIPENPLAGGNRIFSAAKVYQRGEADTLAVQSSSKSSQIINDKNEYSLRGSQHIQVSSKFDSRQTSSVKTPSHRSKRELSRLRLSKEYDSEDSESTNSERIRPQRHLDPPAPDGSPREHNKSRDRKNRHRARHFDDEPSSSSSDSSSSSESSSVSSDSTYRSPRGQKGKKSISNFRDESDSESSSSSSNSSSSEESFKRRSRRKSKKARDCNRDSTRTSRSKSHREGGMIRYIQTEPREFGELKLEKLTVDDAVRFLEKYNNLCSIHNGLVPHISRFIPLSVQQALISAQATAKGKFYKSYEGLYELTSRKVLSMIHYAVIAAEVGNKRQYLEQLRRARFPMEILGKDYQPSTSNFKLMRDALAKFQLIFVTRWKFLKKKTPRSFHLPLQKRQHEAGMIQVFTDIVPYGIGKAILENIPLKVVKDCGNNFEQFLREFFKQVEYLTDCHLKAQFLNTVLYSKRNREEREARKTKVQMLDDDIEDDTYLETEQQPEEDLDEHVYALTPPILTSAPSKMIRSQLEIEKSPGGCIQLVQLGSCKKAGCKYIHDDPAVLQATWWYYARRFFNSPYRASKVKVTEAYKDLPTKVTMLTRASSITTSSMQEKSHSLDDPLFEDSPHVVEMLMKSAFPEVEYVDKIHKSGKVILFGEPPIDVSRALFDTGALSAN